ncbi:hypothetical protein Clacol_004955 [Clathrus columnatus]|uniref:Uncharacterized protein n=1 Tax=Clathrus columnatus TaxID=1419009 RepID=A0AAV5AB73_9AGAM|nr:hypothetical protein Clacol_004955 [Clathrus columnatus]
MCKKKFEQPLAAPREASSHNCNPTAKLTDLNNVDANKAPPSLLARLPELSPHPKNVVHIVESDSEEEISPPPKRLKLTTEEQTSNVTEKDEQGFLKDLANLEEITDAQIPQDKVKAEQLKTTASQTMISDHFSSTPPKAVVMPYSHSLFKQVALEWLIASNQPIQAFEHPKFKEMINVVIY